MGSLSQEDNLVELSMDGNSVTPSKGFLYRNRWRCCFLILCAALIIAVPYGISYDSSFTTLKALPVFKHKVLKLSTTRPNSETTLLPPITAINCPALVVGSPSEQRIGRRMDLKPHTPLTINDFLKMTKNCSAFLRDRHYITEPVNEEEQGFPIAFSLLMYKDIDRAERLLRAIYRPQNYYCIHVDNSSDAQLHRAMKGIANCFDNVFIASRKIDVVWGEYTVLEPELVCMRDLYKYKWKYYINLTGQEFPLKTNLDIVKILKVYNGANDIDGTSRNYKGGVYHYRFTHVMKDIPFFPTLTKGSVHIAAQRGFVDFVLNNDLAQRFLNWTKLTKVPDETFFPSLQYNPNLGVPGAFTGLPFRHKNRPHIVRYKIWMKVTDKKPWYPLDPVMKCYGKHVREVCVFGVGDLPNLVNSPHMFANKFFSEFQPVAYDCLEQHHFSMVQKDIAGTRVFNTSYYETLDFVKHHNP